MKRKRRTEILIKDNRSLVNRLKEEIESRYKVTVINESSHGLVIIKTREIAKNTLFYLGETLVTEATVYVNGSIGLGIVQGDEPDLAYNLAVIDVAYKLNSIHKLAVKYNIFETGGSDFHGEYGTGEEIGNYLCPEEAINIIEEKLSYVKLC